MGDPFRREPNLALQADLMRVAQITSRIAEITSILAQPDVPHIVRLKLFADRIDLQKALEKRHD